MQANKLANTKSTLVAMQVFIRLLLSPDLAGPWIGFHIGKKNFREEPVMRYSASAKAMGALALLMSIAFVGFIAEVGLFCMMI